MKLQADQEEAEKEEAIENDEKWIPISTIGQDAKLENKCLVWHQ